MLKKHTIYFVNQGKERRKIIELYNTDKIKVLFIRIGQEVLLSVLSESESDIIFSNYRDMLTLLLERHFIKMWAE